MHASISIDGFQMLEDSSSEEEGIYCFVLFFFFVFHYRYTLVVLYIFIPTGDTEPVPKRKKGQYPVYGSKVLYYRRDLFYYFIVVVLICNRHRESQEETTVCSQIPLWYA